MLRRTLLALLAFASVAFVACSGGDDSAESPSATLATTPVTDAEPTTTTRQLTFEEQVEAAYLKSWEIYTDAMRTVDESRLHEAFAKRGLELVVADIAMLRAAGQYARMQIEHDYTLTVDRTSATVNDRYINHSVAIDAATDEPVEPDPNELLDYTYTLELIEGTWKVTAITSDS